MENRRQDEHCLCGESVLLLLVLDGQVVPDGQLCEDAGERSADEEVSVHQILAEWRAILEMKGVNSF